MNIGNIFLGLGIAIFGTFNALAQTWNPAGGVTNGWSGIACSADGSKLFACAGGGPAYHGNLAPILISTNGGLTWVSSQAPTNLWAGIAVSADGRRVVAVAGSVPGPGGLFTSSDGGATWVSNNIAPEHWNGVTSSADGSKLFAVTEEGQLFSTTNAGANWDSNSAPDHSWAVACSADGMKLVAAPGTSGGFICVSTNSGTTWITNTSLSSRIWWNVACSANGQTLAAVDGHGGPGSHVYTSTDGGTTWSTNAVPYAWSWQNVAVSADGSTIMAAAWYSSGTPAGPIFTTTNAGTTWVSNSIPTSTWQGAACSADGAKLFAVSAGTNVSSFGQGNVWISQALPWPRLAIYSGARNVTVSWLIPSTNYILQRETDLVSSAWVDVTNAPALNFTNLQNQIVLPMPEGAAFYRLRAP